MKIFLLFKELYVDAFRDIGGYPLVALLKLMSFFCFFCFSIALYALIYRVATGFYII